MKNKTTLFRSNLILTYVLSLVFIATGMAQEVKIYELFDNDSQVNTTQLSKTAKASVTNTTYTQDLNNFYDLNYSLKPTIYVQNNSIVTVSLNEIPIKVKLEDSNSYTVLKSNNPIFQTVELIVINIENVSELNNIFDVSALQGFSNLKYIYIQCNQFNSSVTQIQNYVINAGVNITVYFMTVNPS